MGTNAGAETYQILEGSVFAREIGWNEPLTGSFEATPFAPGSFGTEDLTPLHVPDFAMQAGDHVFRPNPPIGFDGLRPALFLEVADQITLLGDEVGLIRMRSGGERVDSSDDHVTFRFLDFRSRPSGERHAIGQLGDSVLPRRLHLEGTLYEVEQSFEVVRGPCLLPPAPTLPPGDGGGIVIGGGGNVFHEFDGFDIDPDETVQFVPPGGSGGVITRVTGDGSSIGGELQGGGQVVIVNPAGVEFGPVTAGTAPTLEQLEITAPDGAIVSYDEVTGDLTVTSEGDLFIDGTAIDLPGLTSVSISTLGSITITGTFTLPPGVVLQLEAGVDIVVDGEIDAPGGVGVVLPPPDLVPVPFCQGLWPQQPDERPVGSFSLVASAARQIDIDVKPRSRRNLLLPDLRQSILVAILGSDDLDIRDIDESSLRLGPGEAEPVARRGRRATRRGYANRDRQLDLLARFDVRDTGVAYGDDEVCLVAETNDGETLEGCDAIQTLPDRLRRALGRSWSRPGRGR